MKIKKAPDRPFVNNYYNDYKDKFKNTIINNNNNIWKPDGDITLIGRNTYSWFDINEHTNNDATEHILNQDFFVNNEKTAKHIYACKKVDLILTHDQKQIINRWFYSYIKMYNATLKYIKTQIFDNRKNENFNLKKLLNYRKIRTNVLKNTKNDIINGSHLPNNINNKSTKIKSHMLDTAIQLACANYKSALSNFKNGNIDHFRIRYWRLDKIKKVIDIEKIYFNFNKGTFCYKELGNVKCFYDKQLFPLNINNIDSACKIHYDSECDRYSLLVSEKINVNRAEHTKKVISLDPGLRKFMTGISENECITICTNGIDKIKGLLNKIDRIDGKIYIPSKKKKKIIKRTNRKIINMVDDMHWKTIKYLTDKYETILIGDMSVKGIVSNDTSNIQKMMKRIAYKYKFFQFKQRLEYKCGIRGNTYKEVNERYTSKMCSVCGDYDENLGGKKTYICIGCGTKMDRDINGCRGIYMKQFM